MEITPFETTIKNFLDNLAKEDKAFAETYKKKNKNIKDCCQFIMNEVKKSSGGKSCAVSDEEVYGLAITTMKMTSW